MNKQNNLSENGSLIERAAAMYDFKSHVSSPLTPKPREKREPEAGLAAVDAVEVQSEAARKREQPVILSQREVSDQEPSFMDEQVDTDAAAPLFAMDVERPQWTGPDADVGAAGRRSTVDRAGLREGGFIVPDAPVGSLAEEFRIVKRQLLQAASGKTGVAEDKRQTILVCSATANEGKTFCAVNLALSMATEKDLEVLLVDGDFSKPEILSVLGLEGGPGLIDAIADADADADPNDFIIQTDIERLSVLPAGRQANNVTELLASQRTRKVLDALTANHPKRIVIFDSPPALMASPASILAGKLGQIVMVVRADQTNEADLREAIGLLSGCDNISLMLNGTGFTASGRRFGTYYGFGQ